MDSMYPEFTKIHVYEPGESCSPGCESSLSHPCEKCGRFKAGMATGPDVEMAKKYIEKLALRDPRIQRALSLGFVNNWNFEQTLTFLVIELNRLNANYLDKIQELYLRE